MSQGIDQERPDQQAPEPLEEDIDPQGTQEHRSQGLIGKDRALEDIGLDECEGHQVWDTITGRHTVDLRKSTTADS